MAVFSAKTFFVAVSAGSKPCDPKSVPCRTEDLAPRRLSSYPPARSMSASRRSALAGMNEFAFARLLTGYMADDGLLDQPIDLGRIPWSMLEGSLNGAR